MCAKLIIPALLLPVLIALVPQPVHSWQAGPRQYQEMDECVGYAWSAMLARQPAPLSLDGYLIYDWSKMVDGYQGPGTFIEVAGSELVKRHYLVAVTYTRNIWTRRDWIEHISPVVVQVDWRNSFNFPNPAGLVSIIGPHLTYHVVMCYRYSSPNFLCQNVEGPNYGLAGSFWISRSDLSSVLYLRGIALPLKGKP